MQEDGPKVGWSACSVVLKAGFKLVRRRSPRFTLRLPATTRAGMAVAWRPKVGWSARSVVSQARTISPVRGEAALHPRVPGMGMDLSYERE